MPLKSEKAPSPAKRVALQKSRKTKKRTVSFSGIFENLIKSGLLERVDFLKKGLSRNYYIDLKNNTQLDKETLAYAMNVSTKTLDKKQIFDTPLAERMLQIAELYDIGFNYFGQDDFREWMNTPLYSIGNRKPIALLDVAEGIILIKDEVQRIQHGIAL
jgi:putative toxin-antitoxin system antitoxin component (TIGR02293 family)